MSVGKTLSKAKKQRGSSTRWAVPLVRRISDFFAEPRENSLDWLGGSDSPFIFKSCILDWKRVCLLNRWRYSDAASFFSPSFSISSVPDSSASSSSSMTISGPFSFLWSTRPTSCLKALRRHSVGSVVDSRAIAVGKPQLRGNVRRSGLLLVSSIMPSWSTRRPQTEKVVLG